LLQSGSFEAEIAEERRSGKLTGVDAEERLKRCAQTLDAYADEVYAAAHAPLGSNDEDS
jgi:hypothetical protein